MTTIASRVSRTAVLTTAVLLATTAGTSAGGFGSTAQVPENTFSSAVVTAPDTLQVAPSGEFDLELTWPASITQADGYRVYRSTSAAGPWTQVADVVGGSTTSWTYANAPQRDMFYMVRSYRTSWTSGDSVPGAGTVALGVRDTFTGTAGAPLVDAMWGSNADGNPYTYTTRNGTWTFDGTGNAQTAAAGADNPRVTVDAGASDVAVTVDLATASGEAVYLRADPVASTWVRARVRRYETEEPVSGFKTEYEWWNVIGTEKRYRQYDTETYISSYTYTANAWGGWNESGCMGQTNPNYPAGNHYHNPHDPSGIMQAHTYTYNNVESTARGCAANGVQHYFELRRRTVKSTPVYSTRNVATSIYYWATAAKDSNDVATGETRPLTSGTYWGGSTTTDPDDYKTGNTRQVESTVGTEMVSRWQTVVEQAEANVVTTLATYDHDTSQPTSLTMSAVGDQVAVYVNGATLAGTVTTTTNQAGTHHGFGLAGDTTGPTSRIPSWSLSAAS